MTSTVTTNPKKYEPKLPIEFLTDEDVEWFQQKHGMPDQDFCEFFHISEEDGSIEGIALDLLPVSRMVIFFLINHPEHFDELMGVEHDDESEEET